MHDEERARFDEVLDQVLEDLGPGVHDLLEDLPLVVTDRPSPDVLESLGLDPESEEDALSLCGLHEGLANTERSVEDGAVMPSEIHVYRDGLLEHVGGWAEPDALDALYDEIRITILHEIGHQMGLSEEDLERLGYA